VEKTKFNGLYDLFAKRLYNYALWLARNKQTAEDIVQAVFIKVWAQPSVPQNEREQEAWLFTIARNQCLDHFRARTRLTRLRTHYARESQPEFYEDTDSRHLWDMLESCNDEERSILYLHLRAGYSYREIAQMQGIQENAVRVRAFRALEKLRKRYIKEKQ
jgi:RNA polymerase sigma-70 factor (ECF subfamily)